MLLQDLLQENESSPKQWFDQMTKQLMNNYTLLVNKEKHYLLEIEFYYSSKEHPDPFTHKEKLQLTCGKWYFHRTGGKYRSGSFKGLDITFGSDDNYGGILIRSMETPEGIVDGPSLCVDHLLKKTGFSKVSELDKALSASKVWEQQVLQLVSNSSQNREITLTPRVGLTLKRSDNLENRSAYIMQPYRSLASLKGIKKGKVYTILSLYRQGRGVEQIHSLTKSPKKTIKNYIESFEEGKQKENFNEYLGKNLSTTELSALFGTWDRFKS